MDTFFYKTVTHLRTLMTLFLATVAGCGQTVDDPSIYPAYDPLTAQQPPEKAIVPADPMKNVFWGDLHIHTGLSADAYTVGVKTTPQDAYTYARGGEIQHPFGYGIKLDRPLDFAAVTDHAEYLGLFDATDPDIQINKIDLIDVIRSGNPITITANYLSMVIPLSQDNAYASMLGADANNMALVSQAWQQVIDAAENNYQPGRFTTFIGYEWTSFGGSSNNLHRNVIYRDSSVPNIPFSALDSESPLDLWAELDQQRLQGMNMMAIPHNGNVSGGKMYDEVDFEGNTLTAEYAETRMRNEPISEVLQVKGASETHPQLSPEDEFANFEIFDELLEAERGFSEPKGSYVRDALKTGLEMSSTQGFNPYRFGVIGSSDGHNSSSPVEEDNYHGKLAVMDGSSGIRLGRTLLLPDETNQGGKWSAMGLAAVWANENTRESIYDAMLNKETYATTGPRITVRFFGGWGFQSTMLDAPNFAELGYTGGVPMGGTLPASTSNTPTFAVWAMKDPEGANLDRIQIVKVWVDAQGTSHEQVFDALGSDGRTLDPITGDLPVVGNTVDITIPNYTNTIGASELNVIWQDPDFDITQEAAYYARVIEIPTPRWSTYSAVQLGETPKNPTSIQERAITSAIWYQPSSDTPIQDSDSDGIDDSNDNCPNTANADQTDSNSNGIGDACEPETLFYMLMNLDQGKCAFNDNGDVRVGDCNIDHTVQHWHITPINSNQYHITSLANNECTIRNNSDVQTAPCDVNSENQQMLFYGAGATSTYNISFESNPSNCWGASAGNNVGGGKTCSSSNDNIDWQFYRNGTELTTFP